MPDPLPEFVFFDEVAPVTAEDCERVLEWIERMPPSVMASTTFRPKPVPTTTGDSDRG